MKGGTFMISNYDLDGVSPLLLARVCGILALGGIVTGAFDIGYVQSALFVEGNAPATIHNILTHPTLFRLGFSAHLFEMVLNVGDEILFFLLFRRVNRIVAAIALFCGFVGIAVESLDLVNGYVPLMLATEGTALSTIAGPQLQALSYLFLRLQDIGLLISFVFYGLDEMASGFLIFRSGFVPRVIGALLGLSGLCYFTHSFLSFLTPSLDARLYPYILYACLPGEGSIALWMATVGLNVAKWKAWTAEPPEQLAAQLA
jgi:hypothetical protein